MDHRYPPWLEPAALSKPHEIAGLVAWATRAEWRGTLAEFLGHHSAQARAAAGIEMEDPASTSRGCAGR